MKPVVMKLAELKVADYNPESRLRQIGSLAESIKEYGLLYPILIDDQKHIVDGHRRFAALKSLKETEIPCLVVGGGNGRGSAALYATVNENSKKHNGNETLGVFLKNPYAVPSRSRSQMNAAKETLGIDILKQMFKLGKSIRTYRVATDLARYCDCDTPEMVKQITKWLLAYNLTYLASKAMTAGARPDLLLACVKKDKPFKFSVTEA